MSSSEFRTNTKDETMKTVSEFPNHILVKGIEAKVALLAEGKTAEEIQASLGESFRYEGDRLKYFANALDVAAQNADGLARVMIMSLAEGEKAPAKAVKVEDHYYVPEPRVVARPPEKDDGKGGRGGRGGRPGRGGGGGGGFGGRGGGGDRGLKEGPWGPTPEQIAAKKGAGKGKTTS
jgi:uncharacterized membrane protein YgcG